MGLCVCVCVCDGLSVCKSHLTSGASVRPENTVTYSAGNGGQNICGVFSETAPFQRSSTALLTYGPPFAHCIARAFSRFAHAWRRGYSAFILLYNCNYTCLTMIEKCPKRQQN